MITKCVCEVFSRELQLLFEALKIYPVILIYHCIDQDTKENAFASARKCIFALEVPRIMPKCFRLEEEIQRVSQINECRHMVLSISDKADKRRGNKCPGRKLKLTEHDKINIIS